MKACLRISTGNTNLDALNDEDLKATWLCSGKPKISFEDWQLAMINPDLEEEEDSKSDISEEDKKNINTSFLNSIRKKNNNGVNNTSQYSTEPSACNKQANNSGVIETGSNTQKKPDIK
jgi:hypothetical protein